MGTRIQLATGNPLRDVWVLKCTFQSEDEEMQRTTLALLQEYCTRGNAKTVLRYYALQQYRWCLYIQIEANEKAWHHIRNKASRLAGRSFIVEKQENCDSLADIVPSSPLPQHMQEGEDSYV